MNIITPHYLDFMQLMAKISAILLLSFFWSCVEDVDDINLPKVEPKLVITSFISPDDTVKVKVTKSVPFNYNQTNIPNWDEFFPPIENAIVTIKNTETNHSITIPYSTQFRCYLVAPTEFLVEYGKEYEINVSAQGVKSVYAKTTVPQQNPSIESFKIDTVATNTDYWEGSSDSYYDYMCTGTINDAEGVSNYYSVGLIIWEEYYYEWEDYYYTDIWYTGGVLFSDTDRDGQEISFKIDYTIANWSKKILYVVSCDEIYFRYHKSLYSTEEGNPFSEPSPLFSNIEGGLGVFCSFTSTEVTILGNSPEEKGHK